LRCAFLICLRAKAVKQVGAGQKRTANGQKALSGSSNYGHKNAIGNPNVWTSPARAQRSVFIRPSSITILFFGAVSLCTA